VGKGTESLKKAESLARHWKVVFTATQVSTKCSSCDIPVKKISWFIRHFSHAYAKRLLISSIFF